MDEMNCNREQAKILYGYAYTEGHSSGMSQISYYLRELEELVTKFNNEK